jgi:hypothetical protein
LSTAGWVVSEVSNQSTGYCPDLSCWSAVASALDRAGLERPDGDLPDAWNIDHGGHPAAS